MRLVVLIVIASSMAACGGGSPPTAPTPAPSVPVADPPAPTPPIPTTGSGILWVMALGNSGICLPEAAVEVVIGGTVVQSGTQATPCDYWGYDGGVLFSNLPVAEVTVRAGATGYVTREITAIPSKGSFSVTAIVLQPAPQP